MLSHVAELYAAVVLTRHAMHYRWSYAAEQDGFLVDAFAGGSGAASADQVMTRMQSYLSMLGVTPATIPAIEASYRAFLDLLDTHFAEHPACSAASPQAVTTGCWGRCSHISATIRCPQI